MSIKLIEKLGRKPIGKQGRTAPFSIYECIDCKKHFEALEWNVNSGKTTRCKSCYRLVVSTKIGNFNRTHGETKTRLFSIWNNIRDRCHNKNLNNKNQKYIYYRDKGVTLCDEWIDDFISFRNWSLLNGYKDSLDIDKDILCDKLNISPKIYSPDTCMWITPLENTKHRNLNIGKEKTIEQYTLDNVFIESFITASEAAHKTNTSVSSISRVYLGKQHTAGGFRWKRKKN